MTIASIDIGTNTVLMVIAEYDREKVTLKTILNEYRIPRIGKALLPGKPISGNKINLLLEILDFYKRTSESHNCDIIIATATNAFRIASNKDQIVKKIKQRTGIDVQVVSGEEESYLSYLGATLDSDKNEKTLVIDIGGGSTEIISGEGDKIKFRRSFQVGVVSGTEMYFKNDPPLNEQIDSFNTFLQDTFAELSEIEFEAGNAIAIAGTPTTLVCIKKNLMEYNEDLIEGSFLKKEETEKIVSEFSLLSSSEIAEKYKAVVKGREDVLLAGSLILFHLMEKLKLEKVKVSTKGIRYGAIVKYMDSKDLNNG